MPENLGLAVLQKQNHIKICEGVSLNPGYEFFMLDAELAQFKPF